MLREPRGAAARGGPSCGERDEIPAGVFARQPPWKDSTLSNRTASPGRDDGRQDQKPLGDNAPLPAAGVPFPACSLARSQRAVPAQRVPAFKHQVSAGRRGAQGCPEGFQSPTADGGNGEGRENRCCRLLSTIIISGISSGQSARAWIVQDPGVKRRLANRGSAPSA